MSSLKDDNPMVNKGNKRNIVVFIRSHNDFDHVLPILDYLINVKLLDVVIYGIPNGYEKCEKHLSYVAEMLKMDVIRFDKIHYNSFDKFLLEITNLIQNLIHKQQKFKLYILNLFFILILSNLRRFIQLVLSVSIRKFIKKLPDNTVILADFATESHFPYKYFIKYSNAFNIPIVSYLHGYYIFDNLNVLDLMNPRLSKTYIDLFDKYLLGRWRGEYYDSYLVGPYQKDKYFKSDMYSDFRKLSRVIEIGIPRFTREWINKFSIEQLSNKKDRVNSDIKVALFVSNVRFSVNIDAFNNLINKLSLADGIDIKIVPHTRGEVIKIGCNNVLATQKSSSEIIQWADVGIVWGTSMVFEMLIRNVTVIIPKFIDSNTTIFEGKGVCIESDSIEGLIESIYNVKSEENKITGKSIDKFINEYVYGNFSTYEEVMNKFYYHIINSKK